MNWTVENGSIAQPPFFCSGNVQSEREESVISAYLVIIVSALISVAAVILNSLICYIMATNSHLRTPSGTLVLYMAITDFLTGIVTVPLSIARESLFVMETPHNCLVDDIFWHSGVVLTMVTLLLLSLLSVDRYMHALHSRKTSGWKLTRKYNFLVALIWLIAIGASVSVSENEYYQVVSVAPGIFIGIVTLAILCIAFTHAKVCLFLLKSRKVVAGSSVQPSSDFRRRWVRKSVVTLIIIIVFFGICCIPRLIYTILKLRHGPNGYEELHRWSATVVFVNSVVNPIIYISRSSNIQRILKRYLENLVQSRQGSEMDVHPL
eukprot:gene16359-7753_t